MLKFLKMFTSHQKQYFKIILMYPYSSVAQKDMLHSTRSFFRSRKNAYFDRVN